jgi:branched-chain amino acid transport system ATP-binding protein
MADDVPEDAGLSCRNLDVAFGGNKVLQGIDFDAKPGFTGLIGPNGAGKTTIFNVISGYVRPTGGQVTLDGVDLLGKGRPAIAHTGVARTFQTPKLIPETTVLENVMLGMDGHRRLRDWKAVLGTVGQERASRREARAVLDEFGLGKYAEQPVSALSLGSQKLIEVVRALLSRPKLLLLDEPAAGVSADEVKRLTEPLVRWTTDNGLCLVIIEHDLELVSELCPTVTVLDFGRVLVTGAPRDVTRHPEVISAYLGASFAAERA